jgi:hypothetical protein
MNTPQHTPFPVAFSMLLLVMIVVLLSLLRGYGVFL